MSYGINKGINRPVEFKGLKAQYIGYLGAGLVVLLLVFALLFVLGAPVLFCLVLVAGSGAWLFWRVYGLSRRYGQYGLMKRNARRYLPVYLKFKSRRVFYEKRGGGVPDLTGGA